MAHRLARIHVLTFAAAVAAAAPVLHAQQAPAVGPYVAQVTGEDVMVRSGPSEGFYATSKLNAGDQVTVVGSRGDWLKIVPPAGSFCFVAAAYVDRVPGSDTAGRVKKPDLNVRAGSALNNSKKIVIASLNTGDPVEILATQDDYYKIAPPAGAYLYVQKDLVKAAAAAGAVVPPPLTARATERVPIASDPVPAPVAAQPTPDNSGVAVPLTAATPAVVTPAVIEPAATYVGPLVPAIPTPAPAVAAVGPAATPVAATPVEVPPPSPVVIAADPAPRPSAVVAAASVAAVPSTRPATVVAIAKRPSTTRPVVVAVVPPRESFAKVEALFELSNGRPLDKQPLEGMRWRYKTLANNPELPASMRETSSARLTTVLQRIDALKQMQAMAASATAAAEKQKSFAAEQQELAERIKQEQASTYAALGTLRISSLQQTGTTLYRLTDPKTFRTLVYLRSNDPKYTDLLNKFVGVHGQIVTDSTVNIRYVTPTDVEVVDMARVNNGVLAAISPPSLLTQASDATAGVPTEPAR